MTIEKKVMASVRMIYVARTLGRATALKVYALAASACAVVAVVSVSHVAANFALAWGGGEAAVASFLFAAVLQTKLVVQVALLAATLSLLSLCADMVRSLSRKPLFVAAH